jgi:hypothetical protein
VVLRFAAEVRLHYLGERVAEVMRAGCLWSIDNGTVLEVRAIGTDPTRVIRGGLHWVAFSVDVKNASDAGHRAVALRDYLDSVIGSWARLHAAGAHVTVEWDTWPFANTGDFPR